MSARTNAQRLLWRCRHSSRAILCCRHGCIQNDRGTLRHQRKRLLHREKDAFHIDVEARVIVLLSYRPQRGERQRDTGIREHDIELALLLLNLCELAIKIGEVRHVSLYAGYISSDLLNRRSQLRISTPRDEDVRAFVHKLLCRRKANAAITTSNECDFSFKLAHVFSPLIKVRSSGRLCRRGDPQPGNSEHHPGVTVPGLWTTLPT